MSATAESLHRSRTRLMTRSPWSRSERCTLIARLSPCGPRVCSLPQGPPLPEEDAISPAWVDGSVPLAVSNEGGVPIALTSHFHVFEANRQLRFDRRAAWGMRLAVGAGVKVVVEPGRQREIRLLSL